MKGFLFGFLLLVIVASVTGGSNDYPGVIGGGYNEETATKSASDWYDYDTIDVAGGNDTIKLDSLYGANVLVKAVVNLSTNDSIITFKTANGSGYRSFPLAAGQVSPKFPILKYFLKSGTVNKIGVFMQKINK